MARRLIPEMFTVPNIPKWMLKVIGPIDGVLLSNNSEGNEDNDRDIPLSFDPGKHPRKGKGREV